MEMAGDVRRWILLGTLILPCLFAGRASSQTTAFTTQPSTSNDETIEIRRFVFKGNTVLSAEALEAVARHGLAAARAGKEFPGALSDPQKTINRWAAELNASRPPLRLNVEDLESIRECLTQAYSVCGYINSSAVLPNQDVNGGTLLYQINEGKLSRVNIFGVDKGFKDARHFHFNKGYLERRIRLAAGKILNVNGLQGELEVLKQDPNVTRVNAELKPDVQPNQSYLDLQLEEANRFHLALDLNNKRSPSVGSERFELLGSDTNVTGFADPFNFRYTITDGDLDHIGFAGADDYGFDYSHPITIYGTTLQFALDRSDEPIIEDPFSTLSIKSETESYGVTLRQPLYRTADTELAVFATLNLRENKTLLLGKPYEFSPGEDNGKSRVTALRVGQEFTTRDQSQALSLRSTFSVGFHAFGSTVNGYDRATQEDVPDSEFFDWLGQVQYVRRLGETDMQLVLRGDLQLSADPLLALEQFSIGGFDTVRGYRENEIVRDQGAVASAELHVPVYSKGDTFSVVLAPFADLGYGWNYYGAGDQYPLLGSIGVGAIVHATSHLDAQVYWGHPFKYFNRTSDPQDNGIHFDVLLSLF